MRTASTINAVSPAKTLTALRQLALLHGADARAALAEVMGLLGYQVAFESAGLAWHDENCNLVDIADHGGAPLSLISDYTENFHNHPDREGGRGATMASAHASGARVVPSPGRDSLTTQYLRTDLYNNIMKPAGYGWSRLLPLRRSNGAPLATMILGRSLDRGATDFSARELRFLEEAQPWLEHLLRREASSEAACSHVRADESAMVVVDAQGRLQAASPGALSLLHQAADAPMLAGFLQRAVGGELAMLLKRLSSAVNAGINGWAAMPPTLQINNRWGRFRLYSYALSAFETGVPLQVALHIERHVPLALRLFRAPRFIALSARERETCLHLLAGRSNGEIAQAMAVRPTTVVYFVRQIYRRLDIHRQSDLLPALLEDKMIALL